MIPYLVSALRQQAPFLSSQIILAVLIAIVLSIGMSAALTGAVHLQKTVQSLQGS